MTSCPVKNINIGVLGHVDSGKTSLCKRLSTVASTACFDKNPQSQERGITLDLGFSSFMLPLNTQEDINLPSEIQVTLVDCPGHASLIRTIIGGASIIDLIILVVDAQKGVQTQTAECMVLAEILSSSSLEKMRLVVVLNKTDLFPKQSRVEKVEKMKKKLRATFRQTVFGENVEIVPFSCIEEDQNEVDEASKVNGNLSDILKVYVIEAIRTRLEMSKAGNASEQFMFAVDHCFSIKGQGTVMTGTCLQGKTSVNDKIEIASLSMEKKVKSIQVFRKPVTSIQKGDRAGICLTQFESSALERGLVCYPGLLRNIYGCIMRLHKVRFFKGSIASNSKFHVVVGHETVMAKVTLFSSTSQDQKTFDESKEYQFCSEFSEIEPENTSKTNGPVFMLLQFEKPILSSPNSILIGSKLDSDILSNTCRIAFYGKPDVVFHEANYSETFLSNLKVFKPKQKQGAIDRIFSEDSVICKNMLKKETNIEKFLRLKVDFSTGDKGIIIGGFGQGGKLKIQITGAQMSEALKSSGPVKRNKNDKNSLAEGDPELSSFSSADKTPVVVTLSFKKMIFAGSNSNKVVQ